MDTKSYVGRPPKLRESLLKHLGKVYSNREFTSNDIINSFRLQLTGKQREKKDCTPAPINVKAGMALRSLTKLGHIKVVGEKETGKRGCNHRVYKLNYDV